MIQLITVGISAILWHLGGQGYKICRQLVGLPIGVAKAVLTGNLWAIGYWALLYLMVQGFSYGISSPVHKFWVWVFGKGGDGNDPVVEAVTRATCGLAWSLAGLVFALITGNWISFGVYVAVCTILVTLFGLCPKVRISEIGTGMSVALAVFI